MKYDELSAIYKALLSHPHDLWRAKNQHIYCFVRDAIAKKMGESSEMVQNNFEAYAARQK